MLQVLLFGTSGNPPTGRDGHSGMVDYFVSLGVSQSDAGALRRLIQSLHTRVNRCAGVVAGVIVLVACTRVFLLPHVECRTIEGTLLSCICALGPARSK